MNMKEAFNRDPFSKNFNVLRKMGRWTNDFESGYKKGFYYIWRTFSCLYGFHVAFLGIIDLYQSRSELKKAAFNLCTSTVTFGIFVKNNHLMLLGKRLNKLRFDLFLDTSVLEHPEDMKIIQEYKDFLQLVKKIFYCAAFVLLPIWYTCSLLTMKWGPRELPFPVYMPLDLENDFWFLFGWMYHVVGSIYIITEVIQTELGMFSILFQIIAHHEMLSRKVRTINNIYGSASKEINKWLVGGQTKQILRQCVRRHLILMRYTRELEFCYNKPMMLQLVGIFLLSVGNGLELIVISINFSMKLSYQIGYTLVVIVDVFVICYSADLLKARGQDVAFTLYDAAWYEMSSDVRKELLLVLTGTQKNVQLTAGKMFKLDLSTFQGLMKNIYSWLALFSQVVTRK